MRFMTLLAIAGRGSLLDAPTLDRLRRALRDAANPWKSEETTDSAGLPGKPPDGVPFATIDATNSQLQEARQGVRHH
jgi:hypothetical protein